jgi:AhpD family alkylhydroperoxidase
MNARMTTPAPIMSELQTGIQHIFKAIYKGNAPQQLLELVHLRASQINGCSACVYSGNVSARKNGETDERLFQLAAWREAPFYTDAERAALNLTEVATRLADRSAPAVSDELWDEVADHFDEQQLASIILMIAITNLFNRINAVIQEPAGTLWD